MAKKEATETHPMRLYITVAEIKVPVMIWVTTPVAKPGQIVKAKAQVRCVYCFATITHEVKGSNSFDKSQDGVVHKLLAHYMKKHRSVVATG